MLDGFKRLLILGVLLLLFLSPKIQAMAPPVSHVTYEFSGGRFGDNLLAYLHAKWISYQWGIPLLYKPFPYSSQLVLDDIEPNINQFNLRTLKQSHITQNLFIRPHSHLYICPYFPECRWERENTKGPHNRDWVYFSVNWDDPEFKRMLQKLVSLKQPYPLTEPAKDKINIAIHFREGGSYDSEMTGLYFITKFPPLEFYINGLLEMLNLFKGMDIYCFVFTDALDPESIIEKLKAAMPEDASIAFGCRSKDNFHNRNVLEDFFSLFEFDVLIHPKSNFSLVPALLHEYAVVYSPTSGRLVESRAEIDEIECKINQEIYNELIKRYFSSKSKLDKIK